MTTQTAPERATPPHDPAFLDEIARRVTEAAEDPRAGKHLDVDDAMRNNLINLAVAAAHPLIASAAYTAEGSGEVWRPWETIDEAIADRIWTDLRPSEAVRLMALVTRARERAAAEAAAAILSAITEAGRRFAEEFPDAPRHRPEAVR